MNRAIVNDAFAGLRLSVYKRLFEKQGIDVNKEWLQQKVFEGASNQVIEGTVDQEIIALTQRRGVLGWAYRGFRRLKRGRPVKRFTPR